MGAVPSARAQRTSLGLDPQLCHETAGLFERNPDRIEPVPDVPVDGGFSQRHGQMTTRTGLADDANELQVALASDAAFEAWYAATLPRVYAYVFSRSGRDTGLAEEITQLAFIAAVEQRSRFDGRSDTGTDREVPHS